MRNKFKLLKNFATITGLLFIVGCSSAQNSITPKTPQEIQKEKWEMAMPKIELQNSNIPNWLLIEDLNFYTRDDGLIKIEATFKNSSSYSKDISYKINWKDENGMNYKTIFSKWHKIELDAKENLVIDGISPSVQVKDFKIEFKEY